MTSSRLPDPLAESDAQTPLSDVVAPATGISEPCEGGKPMRPSNELLVALAASGRRDRHGHGVESVGMGHVRALPAEQRG